MAKDATTTAPKAERKKPVRKAPVQKDYPSKLDWLRAMTEYEEAQAATSNKAKVERLDKRIASAQAQVDELTAKLNALKAERASLVTFVEDGGADAGTTEDEQPSA